jgi:hypothetical protein
MIRIEKSFPEGYVRPVDRGIILTDKEGNSQYLDEVVQKALGNKYSYSSGSIIKNINLVIEIEEANVPFDHSANKSEKMKLPDHIEGFKSYQPQPSRTWRRRR